MKHTGTRSVIKRVLIGLPVLVLVSLIMVAWWLLSTAHGAAWIWGQVEKAAAGSVHSSRVNGDLASGFSIHGLEYRSDTVSLFVNRIGIEAAPGWWPLSVQVESLKFADIDIITHPSDKGVEDVDGDLEIPALLESLRLKIPVNIVAAEASNITFRSADAKPRTLVNLLKFSASLGDRILLDKLEVQAPGVTARLGGQLGLEAPFNISLGTEGKLNLEEPADGLQIVFPIKFDAHGDLDSLKFALASAGNGLLVGDEMLDLKVTGTGSSTGILLNRVALNGSHVGMDGSGVIDWSSQLSAGFKLAIHQLDVSPWLPTWPAGKHVVGDFDVSWSEAGLKIPQGSFGVSGTDLSLNVQADLDIEANSVEARLDWNNISWPLADSSPDFISSQGNIDMKGSLDSWTAGGQLDIGLGDYPPGNFEMEGTGNRSSARLEIHAGEILGGYVSGKAGANWQNGMDWDLDIHTRSIDPGPLLPGWPGELGADVKVVATGQPEEIRIRVDSLEGLIRGVSINGRGSVKLAGGDIAFDGVDLRTEDAVLQLDGDTSSPAGTTFKFNGQLPSMLLQGAAGNVELAGRYSSAPGSSLLDVQLKALDLAWNGFGIKSINANTRVAGAPGSVPTVQLDAAGLAWQETLLDELSLSLNPDRGQHRLDASLAHQSLAVSSSMLLSPEDKNDLFATPWQGVLDDMVVAIDQSFSFQLQQQAALKLSSKSLSLGPACMREDAGAALCVNAEFQADDGWSLHSDVKSLPLDYLRDILELNVRFEQFLNGSLEWHQPVGEAPTGGGDFRISAGQILYLDDNDVLTETNEGTFGFALRNGNLEAGQLDLELPGTGLIDIDFDILDIIEKGEKKLRGRAVARLDNLELVRQLAIPFLDDIDGQFESQIQLGGTLGDPDFEGEFGLSNGHVRYAPIGLNLRDITFQGRLEKHNQGSLKGDFKAGEGTGLINGQLQFDDMTKIELDVELSGENLLLINTDDLKINSEVDVRFGIKPQRVDIGGYIRVPSARLTPANLVLEKVSDSEDLVVLPRASDSPSADRDVPPASQVFGQLELAFGDDVLIRVPGIETRLNGSVIFDWNGDPVPIANGSYKLQGQVAIYGPTLQIDNGHISFPGVAANNPLLNIRAEREVYGNTQIRSAGVQLIGSLKRPVLEAFTVPVTNEDRAWTLLITGTDFDQGQSVGGFDVGTYIAPKLYVSYGISIFDEENVISARYDLKKGFGVKVTSGQSETGVDISYTVDRE